MALFVLSIRIKKILSRQGCMFISFMLLPVLCFAAPLGGHVVAGQALIQPTHNQITQVHQQTHKTIINWDSFDIAPGELVQFIQPSASAIALNRVTNARPTHILGNLSANGQIFLLNPQGIVFGQHARVDVAGLLASTLHLNDQDFLRGNGSFSRLNHEALGQVINQGELRAKAGGYIVLAGNYVENSGLIQANLGHITLAASEHMTLDLQGDGLISFSIQGDTIGELAGVRNSGELMALAGRVVMTANVAADLIATSVQNSGVIRAQSIVEQQGEIYLLGHDGDVLSSGVLDVSARDAQANGGHVALLGQRVGLVRGAQVLASGKNGGSILVGGDVQGTGGLRTAQTTVVRAQVVLQADALTQGQGGKVIVWADGRTTFEGLISAQGGVESGDGGFVEVSGQSVLDFTGVVKLNAVHGQGGTLLLDPNEIIIEIGGADDLIGTINDNLNDRDLAFNEDESGVDVISNIDPSVLEALLVDGAASVLLHAEGDITVNDAINNTDGGLLGFNADGDIIINADITLTGPGVNNLLAFNTDGGGGAGSFGDFVVGPGVRIQADNGIIGNAVNVILGAGAVLQTDDASVSLGTGAGNVIIQGDVRIDTNSDEVGNSGAINLLGLNLFAQGVGHVLTLDSSAINNAVGGNVATLPPVNDNAGANNFLGALVVNSQGVTDGDIGLSNSILTDGDITLQGNVLLASSVTLDSNQTLAVGGDIFFARTGLAEGSVTSGNINSTVTASAVTVVLTLDTSASTTGGDVGLGQFDASGGSNLLGLLINTAAVTPGTVFINEDITLSNGAGFSITGDGGIAVRVDNNSVETNPRVVTNGGDIDLGRANIFVEAGDLLAFALTSQGGDIVFGRIDDHAGADTFVKFLEVRADAGTVLISEDIIVDSSAILEGRIQFNHSSTIDSRQELAAGAIQLAFQNGSSVSATVAGVDLFLDTAAEIVLGRSSVGGKVIVGSFGNLGGHFINDVTINTDGPAGSGEVSLNPTTTGEILLDANGEDTADFTVQNAAANIRVSIASVLLDTEQGNDENGGAIDLGATSQIFAKVDAGLNLVLNTASVGLTDGNVVIGSVNDNLGADALLNDLSITANQLSIGATTVFGALEVSASGEVVFSDDLTVGSLNVFSSSIAAFNQINTTGFVSVDAATSSFNGVVNADAGLLVAGSANVSSAINTLDSTVAFTGGNVNVVNPVTISTAAGAGDVIFASSLNGAANVTLTAGTGAVTFNAAVGNITPLTQFSITSASNTDFNASVEVAGNMTFNTTGDLTVNQAITSKNGNILFTTNADLLQNAGLIQAPNGGVEISATNITLNTGVSAGVNAVNGGLSAIKLNAPGNIVVNHLVATLVPGLNIDIDPTNIDVTGNITASGGVSLLADEDINVTAGVIVTADADNTGGGNLSFLADANQSGVGSITAGPGSVLNGESIELSGVNVTIDQVNGALTVNGVAVAQAEVDVDVVEVVEAVEIEAVVIVDDEVLLQAVPAQAELLADIVIENDRLLLEDITPVEEEAEEHQDDTVSNEGEEETQIIEQALIEVAYNEEGITCIP